MITVIRTATIRIDTTITYISQNSRGIRIKTALRVHTNPFRTTIRKSNLQATTHVFWFSNALTKIVNFRRNSQNTVIAKLIEKL